MTDNATGFQYGPVTYPLTTDLTNSLLKDADPVIYWVLQFYKQCLITYVQPRLLAEALACKLNLLTAVGSIVHYDLGPYLASSWRDLTFPILGVRRKSSTQEYRSIEWLSQTTECEVTYLLPHLYQPQAERLTPILHAVEQTLMERTERGMDPSFENGAGVWGAGYANIERIDLKGPATYTFTARDERLVHQIWTCRLVIVERLMSRPNAFSTLAGIDVEHDIEGTLPADGTTEINFQNTVGAGIILSPLTVSVVHGTTHQFAVTGGSGVNVVYSLLANRSGGSINAATGLYTAGATPNVYDIVGVRDSVSPTLTNAVVQVL